MPPYLLRSSDYTGHTIGEMTLPKKGLTVYLDIFRQNVESTRKRGWTYAKTGTKFHWTTQQNNTILKYSHLLEEALMKLLPCLLTCIVFSAPAFSQSVFSVVRKSNKLATAFKPIVISRSVLVPSAQLPLATRVCMARMPVALSSPEKLSIRLNTIISTAQIETQFAIPRLNRPENIYGGYNYLRTMTKLSLKLPNNVEKAYQETWQKINLTRTYNGAHHIVNKTTLEEIFLRMKEQARARGEEFNVNLSEMQNNAPAIFHRLHGNPQFNHIFHNRERQLHIYYRSGMKAVIEDFFEQVNMVAEESGGLILQVPQSVIEGTYLEAELWCKTFNLRWE